jgi:hypothetical protein
VSLPRARAATASRFRSAPSTTSSHEAAAATIERVPFVVERTGVSARGSTNSRGEAPASKASIRRASRSPAVIAASPSSALSAIASSISAQQSTRSYPDASAWAIVEVARMTSTTIPSGAAAASAGVKAT